MTRKYYFFALYIVLFSCSSIAMDEQGGDKPTEPSEWVNVEKEDRKDELIEALKHLISIQEQEAAAKEKATKKLCAGIEDLQQLLETTLHEVKRKEDNQ